MARLPERVFVGYMRHAQRYMLPFRRFEVYLAQIAMLIAQTMGGAKNVTLKDFLFDPPDEVVDEEPEFEDEAQAAAEYLGLPLIRKPKPNGV